ncbi:MAG: energy-coupling factor transporter transmembrane protein EcfT [Bifidobacterium minimum]|nr:energy-coupling factor transporter transmembrane protein EcfT [Bifidobacterium minimum]
MATTSPSSPPSAILAAWILSTMRVNELTTAMRRMHVPDSVTIAAAVMLRFLPSAASRNSAVGDAIRMRLRGTRTCAEETRHNEETRHVEGTRHNEWSRNKPGMMRRGTRGMARALDYQVVPVLSGTIAAADDLSQSALTRGLVLGRERTSIARIGFRARDVMVLAACLTVLALWALAAAGLVP